MQAQPSISILKLALSWHVPRRKLFVGAGGLGTWDDFQEQFTHKEINKTQLFSISE